MVFPSKNVRLGLVKKKYHTSFSTDTASASTRRASSLAGGRSVVGAGRLLRLTLQTWSTEGRAVNFCEHTMVDWQQMAEGEILKQHVGCICGYRGVIEGKGGPVVGTFNIEKLFWRARHAQVVHVSRDIWMIIGSNEWGRPISSVYLSQV